MEAKERTLFEITEVGGEGIRIECNCEDFAEVKKVATAVGIAAMKHRSLRCALLLASLSATVPSELKELSQDDVSDEDNEGAPEPEPVVIPMRVNTKNRS